MTNGPPQSLPHSNPTEAGVCNPGKVENSSKDKEALTSVQAHSAHALPIPSVQRG